MITRLYLVRHATPDLTVKIDYQIPPGPGLNDIGRKQAHEAAEFLATRGLQHVIVSPLQRALQTGAEIALHNKLEYTIDERVAENRSGESRDDVARRVRAALASFDHLDVECLAVVSHGSPLRALLGTLSDGKLELGPYETTGGNPSVPAGIWRAIRLDHSWQLDYVFEPSMGEWDRRRHKLPADSGQMVLI